jgi:Flp pilus assembly protein TadD
LGTIYLRLGRPYEASVRFERALALQPRDVRALTNLGAAHVRLGDLAGAETVFAKTLSIVPKDNTVRCNLAMVVFKEHKWVEAVEQLATAIRTNPSDPNPYYFFGLIDGEMGAREAAIQMLQKAVRLKPDYVQAQTKLKELVHEK